MPTTADVTPEPPSGPRRTSARTGVVAEEKAEKRGGPHHARGLRSHRVARAIGLVLTGAVAFVAVGAAAVYIDLKSKLDVSDVTDLVVGGPTAEPPKDPDDPFAGRALNILVMGTDFRDAENAKIAGHEDGMRSDTTFIAHVSGDRKRMEVVSIPRDSLVNLSACKLPDGSMSAPQYGMFNEAFQIGSGGVDDIDHAAACTINSVQDLTGIPITNHVVVKMTGVIGVVDAIDGVTMCFPEAVKEDERYGDLELPEGRNTLDGRTSIDFLRARHGTGMGLDVGSDLTRIARQQAFIDSMLREILSKNLVTNSPQLYGVIQAVLGSISADKALADPAALAGLAYSLRSIDPSEVVFTELPVVTAASDANRVEWTSEADAIWERIIADEPPPGHEPVTDPRDDATTGDDTATDDATDTATDDSGDPGDDGSEAEDAGKGSGDDAKDADKPEDERLPGVCTG